jgi:hypothetical protein
MFCYCWEINPGFFYLILEPYFEFCFFFYKLTCPNPFLKGILQDTVLRVRVTLNIFCNIFLFISIGIKYVCRKTRLGLEFSLLLRRSQRCEIFDAFKQLKNYLDRVLQCLLSHMLVVIVICSLICFRLVRLPLSLLCSSPVWLSLLFVFTLWFCPFLFSLV